MKNEANAKITVTGRITYEANDSGETKEESTAVYTKSAGRHILKYDTNDKESRIPTHNEITLEEGLIVVKKTGAVNTVMRFKEGSEEYSRYITGHGAFEFTLKCSKINCKISDQRIMASIDYSMWQCDDKISDNQILIRAELK